MEPVAHASARRGKLIRKPSVNNGGTVIAFTCFRSVRFAVLPIDVINDFDFPEADKLDYFVLKPRHSGFYHTPLELLPQERGATVLVLCGFSTSPCVTFTAHDAPLRGFRVVVPRDTTAANSERLCIDALRQLESTVRATTADSSAVDFAQPPRSR